MFDAVFSNLALAFSEAYGGPFHAGIAQWPGSPTYDSGGSITVSATGPALPCRVQVDSATQAMRMAEGFLATDVRLIVIGLDALDTTASLTITAGPFAANAYRLMSVARDPAGIGFECRGRLWQ